MLDCWSSNSHLKRKLNKMLGKTMLKLTLLLIVCCLCTKSTGASENDSKAVSDVLVGGNLTVKREAIQDGGKKTTNKEKKKGTNGKKSKKERRKSKKKSNGKKQGRSIKSSGSTRKNIIKGKKRQGKKKNTKNPRKQKNVKGKAKKKRTDKRTNKLKSGRRKGKTGKVGRKGGNSERKGNGGTAHTRKQKIRKKERGEKKGTKVKTVQRSKKDWKKGNKKKHKGIKKEGKTDRQGTNLTTCVENFMKFSKMFKQVASSVEKQVKIINRKKELQDKKKGKKGNFDETYKALLGALGGNETAPECDGKPIKSSTSRNYKDTLSTLKECETKIDAACNYPINATFNQTLQDCKTKAEKFKVDFEVCFKKTSVEAGCSCVKDITITSKELQDCKDVTFPTSTDIVKKTKNTCTKAFKGCKTSQDDSVEGVGTCKKVNKCGGAKNKTEAARLLKILNPLKEALANTKFADTLKKLGLNTGAGSDGKGWDEKARASRLSRLRVARYGGGRQENNTDGKGCTEIDAEWKSFNTSGDKAVPGVAGDVDAEETNKTISSLNKLNNRETLEADLGSCAKESSRQVTVTLTIVKIRFYIFWCGWFQIYVVEIKIITLEISFGSPPSPAPSPAVVTSAPGGRHVVKQIMKRVAFSDQEH